MNSPTECCESSLIATTRSSSLLPMDPARATLIVAITCASISLVAAFLTCCWFLMMKRTFRHHIIMVLLIADMGKAIWFFVIPLVVLVSGPVSSSSSLCQGSGFFLALAIEASDLGTLLFAIHAVSSVLRPPKRGSQAGLYPFRRWINLVWVITPIIAASLAFINSGNAYVSYGAFCYLPEQPVWYRMTLSWAPRFVAFLSITSVALIISIHVHIKFKHFGHMGEDGIVPHWEPEGSATMLEDPYSNSSQFPQVTQPVSNSGDRSSMPFLWNGNFHQGNYGLNTLQLSSAMSNPTSGVSQSPSRSTSLVRDFAQRLTTNSDTPNSPFPEANGHRTTRTASETPSQGSRNIGRRRWSLLHRISSTATSDSATEELLTHRHSIEQHLRVLFLYPICYMLMWTFPFVSQCMQLTGRRFADQPRWLQILATGAIALQAGVDAAIFCYRERPWKRTRRRPVAAFTASRPWRARPWRPGNGDPVKDVKKRNKTERDTSQETATNIITTTAADQNNEIQPVSTQDSQWWWEVERRHRRDSLGMGTDTLTLVRSRQLQHQPELNEEEGSDDKNRTSPPSPSLPPL